MPVHSGPPRSKFLCTLVKTIIFYELFNCRLRNGITVENSRNIARQQKKGKTPRALLSLGVCTTYRQLNHITRFRHHPLIAKKEKITETQCNGLRL